MTIKDSIPLAVLAAGLLIISAGFSFGQKRSHTRRTALHSAWMKTVGFKIGVTNLTFTEWEALLESSRLPGEGSR